MLPLRNKRRARLLALLLLWLLALTIRTWRAQQEVIASPDVIRFVTQMHNLARHPIATTQSEAYHPLHAGLANLVHAVVGGWGLWGNERMSDIWSLRIVGILAGATLSVQIVRLARWCGAPFWAAWAAGAMWIVGRRQSLVGADGLSDALAWSLFAQSLLVAMPALRQLHRYPRIMQGRFFLAGTLSALSYLTRPEGFAAALILLMSIAGAVLASRFSWRRKRRHRWFKFLARRPLPARPALHAIACILAGFLAFSLPYMFVIHGFTLKKTLTTPAATPIALPIQASPVEVATDPPLAVPPPGGIAIDLVVRSPLARLEINILKIAEELQETFSWSPWLVLLIALPLKPRLWGRPRLRLLVVVWGALWLAVMFWLLHRAGYLDGRHTLPLVLLLHVLLALAFAAWTRPMALFMARYRARSASWRALPAWRKSPRWPTLSAIPVILLALVPGILLFQTAPRADRANLILTAKWIQDHARSDAIICDREHLVGYYCGHPYATWTGLSTEPTPRLDQIDAIRQSHNNAPVLLGLSDRLEFQSIGPYRQVARFTSANHTYVLYATGNEWQK